MKKIEFYSPVFESGNEKELLLDCLRNKRWSSFKGGTEGWNIEKVLKIKSIEAKKFKPLAIRYLGGKYVRDLEALVSKKFNVKYCVSANSATSCLSMAIGSLNLGPGDEVILPSMSWISTATSILSFHAIPVFCEVKDDTFCIDPDDIVKKISSRTKAIMVVHLGGNAADMFKIKKIAKKFNLKIIEDCAQAPGVKYRNQYVGTIGDVGIFSMTETKNITSGEGGLLITNNSNIAMKSRLIRNHGEGVAQKSWSKNKLLNVVGMNYRLTEFQAAIAIPQFKSLDSRNKKRKILFEYLLKKLKKYEEYLVPPKIEKYTEYYCYMLKWKWNPPNKKLNRNVVVDKLKKSGIPIIKGYQPMMHMLPIFSKKIAFKNGFPWSYQSKLNKKIKYGKGAFPKSEKINDKFIWFKYINPPNSFDQMDKVIKAFDSIFSKKNIK